MRWRLLIYGSLLVAGGAFLCSKSNYRKLQATDRIYQELKHPEWSERVLRAKEILPNMGSGDHKMLYLVDVRRVSIPLSDAIQYYEKEADRLGFRECHVDGFPRAKEKFQWDWEQMRLDVPQGDHIVVISQNLTSDSTIRRHKPAEQAGTGQPATRPESKSEGSEKHQPEAEGAPGSGCQASTFAQHNMLFAMRPLILASFAILACAVYAEPPALQSVDHKVIHDERTFVRDANDRRYSIWTDDQAKAAAAMKELGFGEVSFELKAGQILAVFFNDNITEDLVQIAHNKSTRSTFADYADSGIEYKLRAADAGKKYSHATVVIFTPIDAPSHLGLRVMSQGGLSDRK